MPNSKYRRGATTEYRIMKQLEEEGYTCTRSSGSHGMWDIVAINSKEVKLIQAKRVKKGKYYKDESLDPFIALEVPVGISKELWVWVDRKGFEIIQYGKKEEERTKATQKTKGRS